MKQTSLKSNFLFNLIYQILAVITPIFTTPYISRVLSADGIGKYSYALSIVTYFGIFGCLGTATYGQLEIARNRDNKKLLHKTVSEIFFWAFSYINDKFINLLCCYFKSIKTI